MSSKHILRILLSVRIPLILAALIGLVTAPTGRTTATQTESLIDCRDFIDQAEAQRFFEATGGPMSDPYHLDADGDGIACEPGPPPTPVSQGHAEYCEGFLDYLGDSNAPDSTVGERYRQECADYIEQERGYPRCPAHYGLSFRYFSSLGRDQVNDLSDMQKEEYDSLMSLTTGQCVAVDVARTSAWQCQPFPFYVAEYQRQFGIPINDYYYDELSERYQVVCMGAPIDIGRNKYPLSYLIGAGVAGAVIVCFYSRYKNKRETLPSTHA